MDQIDRALLTLVQRDGRGSYARLGQAVGLSAAAVHDRLKKLFRSGAIRSWSAVVAPERAGLPSLAFVLVQIDLPANVAAFVDALAARPEVLECHLTSGAWSCLLKVRGPSAAAVDAFVADRVASLPGVLRVQRETVTTTGKETHILALDADGA